MLTTPPDLFLCAHPYDLSHLKVPFSWHPLLLPAVESRCVWRQGVLSGIPCHKAGSKSGLRYMVQPWRKALRQSGDSQVGALVDWHSAGSLMTPSFIFLYPLTPVISISHNNYITGLLASVPKGSVLTMSLGKMLMLISWKSWEHFSL